MIVISFFLISGRIHVSSGGTCSVFCKSPVYFQKQLITKDPFAKSIPKPCDHSLKFSKKPFSKLNRMEQQEQHFRSGFRKPHLPILKKTFKRKWYLV